MTANDIAILVALGSLVVPILIVFLWAHMVNKRLQHATHRLEGFGGWLLVFIVYLFIFKIPISLVGLLSYLAHNSSDLRSPLLPVLTTDTLCTTALLVFSVVSAILLLRLSCYLPIFYWRTLWIGFIILFIDFLVASGYALVNYGVHVWLLVMRIYILNKQFVVGDITLPILSALYILKSRRVRNTFLNRSAL